MKFTKIPESTFKNLQINAGVLLTEFDPAKAELKDTSILGATTGGINFAATPTFSDYGEDIDNCPKNMRELKKLESWDIKMSGNFVTTSAASAKRQIGAADIDDTDSTKITPRNDILEADFFDLWLVGDYSDENGESNGGFVAVHMMNVLSTGGFQMRTTDKGKGQFAFEYAAHYTMAKQSTVPFEVYIKPGTSEEAVTTDGTEE